MSFSRVRPLVTLLVALGASPGRAVVLDPGFGDGGRIIDDTMSPGIGVIVEPGTHRIIVATETTSSYLVAYLPDGTLDGSFGTGGRVLVATSIWSLARQPTDGSYVVGGFGSAFQPALQRFDPAGNRDATFGGSGEAALPVSFTALGLVVQQDGRILAAGDNVIVRLLDDGTPDPGFGTGGVVTTGPIGDPATFRPTTLALLPGGQILAGGSVGGSVHPGPAVARYASDGTTDVTFDGD